MGAHTTSDDPTKYRTREEEQSWRDRDPIDRIVALLKAEGEWDEDFATELEAEGDALALHVREYVRGLGRPTSTSMFEHVYATEHSILADERAWFEKYDASFADGGAR